MSLSEKLIINAALTGMVPTKRDNPHLPVSPEEIAADAKRCREAGASIVHLHAREACGGEDGTDGKGGGGGGGGGDGGGASWRPEVYREILQRVREACPDLVLCVSTSGRVHKSFEQRSAVLDLRDPAPEMASLTLGSMNFAKEESVNSPEMIRALAGRMRARGIVPELECFDLGMAEYAGYLVRQGILAGPLYCNILLGSLGTLGAGAFNLSAMVRALPAGCTWAAAGIGRFQFEVNALAVVMGGHVRVGLEDNLWLDAARTLPASNALLIERIVKLAGAVGRPIATPAEARAMIGLAGRG